MGDQRLHADVCFTGAAGGDDIAFRGEVGRARLCGGRSGIGELEEVLLLREIRDSLKSRG